MTTVDHLVALCGSLRHSWGWLADSVEPGNARRNQRALTDHAKAKRNERALQDRNDKPALTNAGRIVGGGQPPANLGAIEARLAIADQIDQLAAELSLAIASVHRVGGHYTNNASTDAKFTAGLNWVSRCAGYLRNSHLIDDAYERLSRADNLARNITGDNGDRRRFAAPCPCCSRRSLAWDQTSTEASEWFVECTSDACRCRGTDCACSIPGRQHGMSHVWTTQNWRTLAAKLE